MYERNGLDLGGKRALVTGGGSGLGQQIAEALAEAGAEVVICGRNEQPLQRTAETIEASGNKAISVAADITSESDLAQLRAGAGPIDILVNNAGRAIRQPWQEATLDAWRQVMAVNVEAPLRLTQVFVPAMVESGWGRVINIASMYGSVGGDPALYGDLGLENASYFASKHALIGLTRHLAGLLGPSGVTVNALSPGAFPDTPGNEAVGAATLRDRFAERTPVKRVGGETDLRAAVVFLACPGSSFYTGQDLTVDGGWTAW